MTITLKNTPARYGTIAKLLHWSIFLLIACMLALGFTMDSLPLGPDKLRLYGIHKATGMVILALVAIRLLWRLCNIIPELPSSMRWYERWLAHASHWGLYTLMVIVPLSGWLMSSAAGFPISIYGLFTIPSLMAANKELVAVFKEIHEIGIWLLIGLVGLHIAAALMHHFYYKDTVLVRMLPFAKAPHDEQHS